MPKFSTNKSVSPIKASDLKKEIVKKNKELKAANNNLIKLNKESKANLSKSEKLLRKIDDQIFDRQMSLDSIDITLMKRKSVLSDKDKELKGVINSLSKQMSERVLLDEDISNRENMLSKYKQEVSDIQDNIKDLESKEQELADLQKDISKSKKSASNAKSAAKKAEESCKTAKDKASKKITAIQQEVEESLIIKKDMDSQVKSVVLEYKDVSKAQDEIIKKKSEEIEFANNKKSDMEVAISNYKKEIADLQDVIQAKKDEIESVKADYKKFKLNAFDEMARLKMRGKLETIDKAGLSDVFGK